MPLKDLLDNDATAVAVNTKVRDVAKIMKDKEVGAVVVVKRMNKVKKSLLVLLQIVTLLFMSGL